LKSNIKNIDFNALHLTIGILALILQIFRSGSAELAIAADASDIKYEVKHNGINFSIIEKQEFY
jgi:hypothetical protein